MRILKTHPYTIIDNIHLYLRRKKDVRIFKSHPLISLLNGYLVDSPQPSNISYLWNFGSLLGFCLIIQIVTGVTLAMHYNPSVLEAFNSVEHIMRDVNNGWLIRYLHSNTASAFFFLVYLHIGRRLYYGSYRAPRTLVWTIGTVIFILMMATAFLGYVLPYGQMSLWGATVVTNLMSAIPWVGQDIVEFIWGGFSVNNATLNRFFALHFVLPFVLAALALMHLIVLHDSAGSGNPLGVSGNYDRLAPATYFTFKDLVTIFIFIVVLSIVFFMPYAWGIYIIAIRLLCKFFYDGHVSLFDLFRIWVEWVLFIILLSIILTIVFFIFVVPFFPDLINSFIDLNTLVINLTESEIRNQLSSQLATLCHNINRSFDVLSTSNFNFEYYFEKATHYRSVANIQGEDHFTLLARNEKSEISSILNSLRSDIINRSNLALQAQARFPSSSFINFAARLNDDQLSLLHISDTHTTRAVWNI